jgi:hypothetical protein
MKSSPLAGRIAGIQYCKERDGARIPEVKAWAKIAKWTMSKPHCPVALRPRAPQRSLRLGVINSLALLFSSSKNTSIKSRLPPTPPVAMLAPHALHSNNLRRPPLPQNNLQVQI